MLVDKISDLCFTKEKYFNYPYYKYYCKKLSYAFEEECYQIILEHYSDYLLEYSKYDDSDFEAFSFMQNLPSYIPVKGLFFILNETDLAICRLKFTNIRMS